MDQSGEKRFVILRFRKCLPSNSDNFFKAEDTVLCRYVEAYTRQKKLKAFKSIICSQIKTGYSNEQYSAYIEKIAFYCTDLPEIISKFQAGQTAKYIKNKRGQMKLASLQKIAKSLGYLIEEEVIWLEV